MRSQHMHMPHPSNIQGGCKQPAFITLSGCKWQPVNLIPSNGVRALCTSLDVGQPASEILTHSWRLQRDPSQGFGKMDLDTYSMFLWWSKDFVWRKYERNTITRKKTYFLSLQSHTGQIFIVFPTLHLIWRFPSKLFESVVNDLERKRKENFKRDTVPCFRWSEFRIQYYSDSFVAWHWNSWYIFHVNEMLFSQRCGSIFLSEQHNTLSTRIILVFDSLQHVSNMHETQRRWWSWKSTRVHIF